MVIFTKKKLKTYALYVRNGGEDVCSECLIEQQERRVPMAQRKQTYFPCSIHGDPSKPDGNVLLAWWLYGHMPIKKQLKKGEDYMNFPDVRVDVLGELLAWLGMKANGIFWLEMLEVLDGAYTQ